MIIGVLVVIPTFHGFWELVRDMSLNPLEIAKAFNADILDGRGSNASADRLAKDFGSKLVQYGEVVVERYQPVGRNRSVYGNPRARRLEMADPGRIKNPDFELCMFEDSISMNGST
jgi:hypothetical protein